MKGFILLVLAFSVLEGCSISQTVIDKQKWTKAEFNYNEFQRDKYQCEHESYMEASQIASSGRDGLIPLGMAVDHRVKRYGECMRAKEYYRVEPTKGRETVTETEERR